MTGFKPQTVELIWERDRGRCAMCGRPLRREARGFEWSAHHIQPRGMGGSKDPVIGSASNGVLLCGSGTTGCHGHVESHREDAEKLGYIIRRGVLRPGHVPIKHFLHGVVYLNPDGTVRPAESEG